MDSEDFQKKIDDQIRNKIEGGSKETEGSKRGGEEEEGNTGENQGENQGVDNEEGKGEENENEGGEESENAGEEDQEAGQEIGKSRTTKQVKTRAAPTRQSKRKIGQPPDSGPQLVGPVRIKKPKGKAPMDQFHNSPMNPPPNPSTSSAPPNIPPRTAPPHPSNPHSHSQSQIARPKPNPPPQNQTNDQRQQEF
ncbi:uncharacterized protein MELLADRAFT_63433 [Melampsora larici-populina 98AG31]|uniref:Uncharacterized protein n=1 Tax=Melampsora larici-populina (strain 98AG31 / pathotype 3-4-7) TaxID=747676 RepID=F4RMM0_MELLP|nr:uncharacterized protein MELLADRAFT_63433 [Melampsora larici-populina 98AG31]EGG06357.1 hypothetical protein MELLADRAFT_63433 [Melampsora larici-populina 98AG31]